MTDTFTLTASSHLGALYSGKLKSIAFLVDKWVDVDKRRALAIFFRVVGNGYRSSLCLSNCNRCNKREEIDDVEVHGVCVCAYM